MANGGARPGAGRKRKADKYVTAITKIDRFVAEHMDELLQAQYELAIGVLVQANEVEISEDGKADKPKVYREKPDAKAGQYLIDRLAGKPLQKQELQGKDGEALTIKVVYETTSSQGYSNNLTGSLPGSTESEE